MTQKFYIGDSVVLKTGSPPKIIIYDRLGEDEEGNYFFDGNYRCASYDDTSQINMEILAEEELISYKRQNDLRMNNPEVNKTGG